MPPPAVPKVWTPGITTPATGLQTRAQVRVRRTGPGTSASGALTQCRRPGVNRTWTDLVCTDHSAPGRTETGSMRTSSKEYVEATKSATSARGAIRVRWPDASSTMTSANAPKGLASQLPITIRVPEVVPSPAM
ncbi:hypothetical protein [Aeromicrobium sp. UC242_57]|uniref:hypothetical protein n=1 Tax=Aeromicrobium sp. UC242_57 TaxID=3374624 RepID=UPI0037B91311